MNRGDMISIGVMIGYVIAASFGMWITRKRPAPAKREVRR